MSRSTHKSRRRLLRCGPTLLLLLSVGCTTARDTSDSLAFHEYEGERSTQKIDTAGSATQSRPSVTQSPNEPMKPETVSHTEQASHTNTSPRTKASVTVAAIRDAGATSAANESVQLAGFQEQAQKESPSLLAPMAQTQLSGPPALLPPTNEPAEDRYPINLPTALELAGANNLQIALATERVREALARLDGAEVLWLPSLNAGIGYNSHTGQLQATEGDVIEVNRESFFVGGGPVLGGAPLTGASGGPARLFIDLSPADIFFEPLAARQAAAAAGADESAVLNDTLLEVTTTYLELMQAQSEAAIAQEAIGYAEQLAQMAEEFSVTGVGLEADAARAQAELAERRGQRALAQERLRVISAELARLLRLDPGVTLHAVDAQVVPLHLIEEDQSPDALVAQGLTGRPELDRHQARVRETLERLRQEKIRPWLPNLHLGASSGGFGGGPDDFFGDFSDRTDFDVLAVWELSNLGLGNRARQQERESQHWQAHLAYEQIRDRVATEVTQAFSQVQYRRVRIEEARAQVEAAARALPLNFQGIRGRALRVIEAQQAIAALATARSRYLTAVIAYNQAQFALLRAIGQPPA